MVSKAKEGKNMEPKANPGKKPAIAACGRIFLRLPVRTHFVKIGEALPPLLEEYARPWLRPGDILGVCEKIVALSQQRVVYRKDIHPGFWAKLLSRFVHQTAAGVGAGEPYKMQLFILQCGLWRVLLAALCSAFTRPFGIKGVFYRVCGRDAAAIDGLTDQAVSFPEYVHYGILAPAQPDQVCARMARQLGVPCTIMDACDLNVEILGVSPDMPYSSSQLAEILRDNPAGQSSYQTPLVIIRPADQEKIF